MRSTILRVLSGILLVGCGGGGGGGGGGGEAPSAVASQSADAPPACLGLLDAAVKLCHRNETEWSLAKETTVPGGWTVTAVRGVTGSNLIDVHGFVRIRNSGGSPAKFGNLVLNLQRWNGSEWTTVSSVVATASQGDGASIANVVPGAAWESWKTSFSENAASKKLDVGDASFNSVFSFSGGFAIGVNQKRDLLFTGTFDNSLLAIPVCESVYVEVLASFSPAGTWDGASGANVDVDGNGSPDPEAATLATDFCTSIPVLDPCNDSVTLTDTAADVAATPGVTWASFSTDIGGGSGVETISASAVRTVSVWVDPASEGSLSNTARLEGEGRVVTLWTMCPPAVVYSFHCCEGARLRASRTWTFGATPGIGDGTYRTCTQGGWGSTPNGSNPGQLLADGFAAHYPDGVEVGVGNTLRFTSAAAVEAFLPAGGTPGVLTSDLVNPLGSSAGVFGGQVVALRLNVDFFAGLGSLQYSNPGDSLDGKTVVEILAAAELALGGGSLPAGHTLPSLNDLATNLNEAFLDMNASSWAVAHLSP